MQQLNLSALAKTWFIDFDGTIVKHGGYYINQKDEILPNVLDFFKKIPASDKIIITTAREQNIYHSVKQFMDEHGLRYDMIIMDCPIGERIVINDKKPSGLLTAFAVNLERDVGINLKITENPNL